jgi:hypothetical protein
VKSLPSKELAIRTIGILNHMIMAYNERGGGYSQKEALQDAVNVLDNYASGHLTPERRMSEEDIFNIVAMRLAGRNLMGGHGREEVARDIAKELSDKIVPKEISIYD